MGVGVGGALLELLEPLDELLLDEQLLGLARQQASSLAGPSGSQAHKQSSVVG